MKAIADLLKKIYLFRGFSETQLEAIARVAQKRVFNTGQRVFYEGNQADAMYIIGVGTLKMIKSTTEGDDQELVRLSSGSHFGEMPFLDGSPRSLTAEAVEHCEMYEIQFAKLKEVLDTNDSMAAAFYREVAHYLVARLRQSSEALAVIRSHHLRS